MARDNNNQFNIEKLEINNGITKEEAEKIYDERLQHTLTTFSQEAANKANERNEKFVLQLVDLLGRNNALAAFVDPSFQFLLGDAQKVVASTDREHDYDLLSKLILRRAKNGDNKNREENSSIRKAIGIVSQISDETLAGLTLFSAVLYFRPACGLMEVGLNALDGTFKKLLCSAPPSGVSWLEQLDMLDAVRLSHGVGGTKRLEDYWYDAFDGYVNKGVKEGTTQYQEVMNLTAQLQASPMVEYKSGYFKLAVRSRHSLEDIVMASKECLKGNDTTRQPNEHELKILSKIYDLYSTDKMAKEDFIKEIEGREYLYKMRQWWNSNLLPYSIRITPIGKVLADVNIHNIDKSLPHII